MIEGEGMSPTAEKTIDESALTKGQLRKLNALRRSVGPDIGERAFAEWLTSQAKAEKADENIEAIAAALWPLVEEGNLTIRRGGYLVRRGRGRLLVEPLKPTSEAAAASVEDSIGDVGEPEVGTFGAVVQSGE